MKKCSKCKELKEDFNIDRRAKDGKKSNCRECLSKYNKKRRKENPESNIKVCSKYYYKNKDRLLEEKKIYYEKNREAILIYKKQYGQTPNGMEVKRLGSAKRRALKVTTADGSITKVALDLMLIEQNKKCNGCSIDIEDRTSRHLDHIIALSKGGPHNLDNVQWLCCSCNLIKYNK